MTLDAMEETLKRFYAEEIRALAALPDGPQTERLLSAFASVPREDHAGPGPWLLRSPQYGLESRRTSDGDPRHLYHNVLIALDEERGINVGEPSLWARFLLRTSIEEGTRILQVGAGSGYYTAILAELTGPHGYVVATEVDPDLAEMATVALRDRANVSVRHMNGATELNSGEGPFDLVIAFAGVTHPAPRWQSALKPDGRMLLPLTGESWWGAMVLFTRSGDALRGTTLGRCGFFHCAGARDPQTAQDLIELWSNHALLKDAQIELRMDGPRARYVVVESNQAA